MSDQATPVTILLVEDNPQDVEIAEKALNKRELEAELIVARDGQEALDVLFPPEESNRTFPGLILLDLNLPRVHGHDVLTKIKGNPRTRRIPVILLTTSSREADIVRGYDSGANSYILKPFEFEAFLRVVASIGDYWLVTATLSPASIREVLQS